MKKNYTPIDHLIKKFQKKPVQTSFSKESEPQPVLFEKRPVKETVEPIIKPESQSSHISVRKETIKLPPDLKKLGLKEVGADSFSSWQNIKLPISDEKILKGRQAPLTSSLRWLSTLALYILKKAHLTLKTVGGKVVRVVKN